MTRPMRIQIDKQSVDHSKPMSSLYNSIWTVTPAASIMNDEACGYRLEIELNGALEGGESIRRFGYKYGDHYEFTPDAEFEQDVQAVIEHEEAVDDMTAQFGFRLATQAEQMAAMYDEEEALVTVRSLTEDEAAELLHKKQSRYPYALASAFGFNLAVFDLLIDGWHAANQFIDFGYASRH